MQTNDLLPAELVDSTRELLIQPSIRDISNDCLAGDDVMGRLTRLDLSRLLIYDIDHVVAGALPILMQQFSRMGWDGWEFAETDAERRSMIKTSIPGYHRLKGTLAGFRVAARMARSKVIRAVQPPAKIYQAPALTVPERNAFLLRYPQLRLYPYRTRGVRIGMHCGMSRSIELHYRDISEELPGDVIHWPGFSYCGGGRYSTPETTDAVTRLAEVGYLEREGVETKIFTMTHDTGVVEVRTGSTAYQATFCHYLTSCQFTCNTGAAARIYRTRFTGPYAYTGETLHLRTVQPGLDPIELKYELVAERGQARGTFLAAAKYEPCRWSHVSGWAMDQRAGDRMYKRFFLFDDTVPVLKRGAALFIGAQRFGMPAFHAEILTSVPTVHPRRVLGQFSAGYWPTGLHEKLDRTMHAFRAVTRYADRVKVNIKTHVKIRANTTLRANTQLISGEFIPH